MPTDDQPAADPSVDAASPELAGAIASKMPLYRSHKEVRALRIHSIEALPDGRFRVTPEEAGYVPFVVEAAWVNRAVLSQESEEIGPLVGGFYVVYADGFASWSPDKAFTEGYTRIG